MPTGIVKWFNYKHGYGFIVPEQGDGDDDIFVHITAVQNSGMKALYEGQKVKYDVSHDEKKGKNAAENLSVLAVEN